MKSIFMVGWVTGILFLSGCDKVSDDISSNANRAGGDSEWLISKSEVYDGGPGKDGIPSLTRPEFIEAGEADYLGDNDLVLGIAYGGEARAYPHLILDWHEIINDELAGLKIAVTYCPLTGTGIGWNRVINGTETTFGVSGLLYNSNLIPYDRESGSNWSQLRLDCVNGVWLGSEAETYALVETTWHTWKRMYPGTRVVSSKTGHNRDYGYYPYGNYRTSHEKLIFPVANKDDRLDNKTRVHGIINKGNAKVYPLDIFGDRVRIITDLFNENEFVIIGSNSDNFAMSFFTDPGDGSRLIFSAIQDEYPVVMSDQEGNKWDIFGHAVTGPRKDSGLVHARSLVGYWFSFAAFYPELVIHPDLY